MKKAPNQYRVRRGFNASDNSYENNGFFVIPHYKVTGYELRCQISDVLGWEHVSVTVAPEGKHSTRCPTWTEMCFVKNMFWNEDECVIEYHPPKNEYVSCHEFCLHLWKPIGMELPLPNSLFVGPKEFIKQ
jgi:hypothetical protein